MDKKSLIDSIMARSDRVMPRSHVELVLQGLAATVQAELASAGTFSWPGVGSLQVVTRKPRQARNPRTGETMDIPEKRVVRIRPFKALRDAL